MAWTETDPMKERLHFVTDWDRRLYTVTELCARYGVSRKTGYKWLARYADVGVAGLAERSRAPHRCPHRIAPAVAAAISSRRGGNTRAGVPASCSYGSPTTARGSSCPQRVRRAISCTAGDSCGGAAAAEPGSIRARPRS